MATIAITDIEVTISSEQNDDDVVLNFRSILSHSFSSPVLLPTVVFSCPSQPSLLPHSSPLSMSRPDIFLPSQTLFRTPNEHIER